MRSDDANQPDLVRTNAVAFVLAVVFGLMVAWFVFLAVSAVYEFASWQVAIWKLTGGLWIVAMIVGWAVDGIRSDRRPRSFEARRRELKRVIVAKDRATRGGRVWILWLVAVATVPFSAFGVVVGPNRGGAFAMLALALFVVWIGLRALDVRINKRDAPAARRADRTRELDSNFGSTAQKPHPPEWQPDPALWDQFEATSDENQA